MWPWGHAGVGVLCYLGYARFDDRERRLPLAVLLAVLVGTQFPDLVDKPLAWSVPVLPTGRSLAHSALTASGVAAVALLAGRRTRRYPLGVAFVVGYASHLASDALYPALAGEFHELSWLLWPVLPSPEFDTPRSFAAHFADLSLAGTTLFEVGLFAVALLAVLDHRRGFAS